MRRFGTGAASACDCCLLDRAHGSSSIASAGPAVQARKRRSRSVHGLPSMSARRLRRQDDSRAKSPQDAIPARDIRETKRRERAVLGSALDDYEAWTTSRRLRKVPTMMSALRRGLSHLLQRDLAELDRVVLIDAIERIERSGKIGAARDFRKHLRTFLNRQLSLGVITIDPRPDTACPPQPRTT